MKQRAEISIDAPQPRPLSPSHQKNTKNVLKQVAALHAAALEQDASAFDYDGVYDEMKAGGGAGGDKGKKKTLVGGSGSKATEAEAARR